MIQTDNLSVVIPAWFDICISYPQWQGSGRSENLARGAAAAAETCGRYAPLTVVPISDKNAESAYGVNRWEAIFAQFVSAREILVRVGAKRILTAGGDCAVDVAVIGYLNNLYRDLSVIWIDAHLDANTPETSPSGNFHGMPVSAILGRAPAPMQSLLGKPVDPARFYYFGTRIGDAGDLALQQELGLKELDRKSVVSGPVHIHFDLDVLDPQEFPYVAYPDGDLKIDEAIALVDRIASQSEVVGLTITEFAPRDDADARSGSAVIARICEAALRRGRRSEIEV